MGLILHLLKGMLRSINRRLFTTNWKDLRQVKPISTIFGLERGTPIDRYYIETFLHQHSDKIKGKVIEIEDRTYMSKYNHNITEEFVFKYGRGAAKGIIHGDLTDLGNLPEEIVDCFICTQTLNFIYDYKMAIKGIYQMLKEEGCVLATVSGLSQISSYDMNRWGDYWRFTTQSIEREFGEVFGEENIEIKSQGNVLASVALLHGLAAEELKDAELQYQDPDYQITITVCATKNGMK